MTIDLDLTPSATDAAAASSPDAATAAPRERRHAVAGLYNLRDTGNSFTDFVNRVRINNACHLLMQTDHYVTDICYQVGFNNVANFNRRFLEIKGMTPSEFRRQAESRFGGAH